MIKLTNNSPLTNQGIDSDTNHLVDSLLRYALYTALTGREKYVCECFKCDMTYYTSIKQCNCEYCGSSDPEVFTCTELK